MSYMELFYPASDQTGWLGSASTGSDSTYHRYSGSYGRSYPSSAVVLHVSMCCEQCVKKVRKSLKDVDDVESVDVDMQRQKVIVAGYVNPERVLRKVQKVKKSATFWDSSHDYAYYNTGAYDYNGPVSSAQEYNYYSPSSSSYNYSHYSPGSYDYGYNYPSSHEYSRPNSHHHQSYDAYRYR